eukprot:3506125-Amphidinium_carterae.1
MLLSSTWLGLVPSRSQRFKEDGKLPSNGSSASIRAQDGDTCARIFDGALSKVAVARLQHDVPTRS